MHKKNGDSIVCRDLTSSKFSAQNDEMLFPAHRHSYYEIVITYENNFIHTINDKAVQPQVGDAVILRPGDRHAAAPTAPAGHRVRDIYIPGPLFSEVCKSLSEQLLHQISAMPEAPSFRLSEQYLDDLEDRIRFPLFAEALTPRAEDGTYVEMIKKSVVTELLGQYIYSFFIEKRALPDCLVNLTLTLHDPKYKNANIEDIAEALGYSHTYLCHKFSEYFGKTIQQYMMEEKLENAIPLLLQTKLSVKQIAIQLGWKRVDNFIKAFKKVYDITPGQYRITMRKKQ